MKGEPEAILQMIAVEDQIMSLKTVQMFLRQRNVNRETLSQEMRPRHTRREVLIKTAQIHRV